MRPVPWMAITAVLAALGARGGVAHEIDQYTVPVGKQLVELGSQWNQFLFDSVRMAVDQTNRHIETALRSHEQYRLLELRSPDGLAKSVLHQRPGAWVMIERWEKLLRSVEIPHGPDEMLGYRPGDMQCIFSRMTPLPDPRALVRISLMRCSTIKVHGTYMGTDKIGHFYVMGNIYYEKYRQALAAGKTEEQAVSEAISCGTSGVASERGLIGTALAGVYSNADLVANYVGFKFYRNLTEPVRLKGQLIPPLVERDGEYWRLARHVDPAGPLFGMYVSTHYDEVLNPCLYDWGLRVSVRSGVKKRAESLLTWYSAGDPSKQRPEYFEGLRQECLTYYGEEYGHRGEGSELVTVADTCFPKIKVEPSSPIASPVTPVARKSNSWFR